MCKPETLLESELLGHEKVAFTGPKCRQGGICITARSSSMKSVNCLHSSK